MMEENQGDDGENTDVIAPEVAGLGKETRARLSELRNKLER